VGGAAASVKRFPVAALGVLCVVAAATAAWALAYPQNSPAGTLIRAVADCSAVITLGLVVVPMFDEPRHRGQLAGRAAGPLILASAAWAVAELIRLFLGAAEAAGSSAGLVSLRITVEFALDTAAGRSNLLCMAAALVVCAVATAAPRTSVTGVVAAGAAAMGIAGRSLVGHLSESPVGGLAVAVHTLAAALWCGALAALVLTVSHRGQWARVLPRFSQVSLVCVVVLLVGGTAGAVVTLHNSADLVTTGYGRVLAAKIVVTTVLVVLAWRNRAGWLPAARSHRATASVSRVRSRIELAIMAVALTLAAALAVTG
jgi:putative copper resistance protein D